MSKVLIVDDEQHYREHLAAALSRDGHEVRTALSGREAIALGCRFRPDVLIADWMLRNHVHGLNVSDALRAVLPDLRTIVITGFPSAELRDSAKEAGVGEFIEKPFDLERMRTAVRKVSPPAAPPRSQPLLAIIEVAGDGAILHANPAARELLHETQAGTEARRLDQVFSEDSMPDLDAAVDRWIVASPRAAGPTVWHLRSQPLGENSSRLVVLRRQNEPQYAGHTLIELVLGVVEQKRIRWPFAERVLVVDRDALWRRTAVSMLESAAATCYGVAKLADALPLLESDAGLRFALLDLESAGDLDSAVKEIRKARPQVTILGMSTENCRERFAAAGVPLFLRKPWRTENLVNLLAGRLGSCVECGLQLPLRWPKAGESPATWACNFCGARYEGLLDDTFPEDARANAFLIQ